MLIAESENTHRRNSGVSNVYTFLHATFEGVEFMPKSDMFIWKIREYRNIYLLTRKRKNNMRCCQFPWHLWWYNKGSVVLNFWIYHVWIRGKIRTSLLMIWMISGAKALLLIYKKRPCPLENTRWGTTTVILLNLEIILNHFPKAIKTFTQHLCGFQKLLSWGGNEYEEVGALFYLIYFWLSIKFTHPWNK